MINNGDQDYCPLTCPGCEYVFFATKEHFATIGARANLCPDCFKKRLLERFGLRPDFLSGPLFG
jgi:hypothetical protein